MFYRMSDTIIPTLMIVSVLLIFFYIQVGDGTVIINKPYYEEYKDCESGLEVCKELKTPNCPDVKCNCGLSYFFLLFVIGIYGVIGIIWWTNHKKEKMKNYKLKGMFKEVIEGITIEESAKEDFKELMGWTEKDFKEKTVEVKK